MLTRRRLRGALAPWLTLSGLLSFGCGGGNRTPHEAETSRVHVAQPPTKDAVLAALTSALPPLPHADVTGEATHERQGRSLGCPTSFADAASLERAVATGEYVVLEFPPFRVRLPTDEATALGPYVEAILTDMYATLTTRYGLDHGDPVTVDLYADANAFRARIGGSREADLDGACCGRAIAMLSPAGGARNWGQTLHHEVAHLFHGRDGSEAIPTWLAEGLAETDTYRARAEWRRESETGLLRLLGTDEGELLERLERSLTSPRSSAERGGAYFVAAAFVAFVEDRHGAGALRALLARFRAGDVADDALLAATGESRSSLESSFRTSLEPRLRAEREHGLPQLSRFVDAEGEALEAPSSRAASALVEGRVDEARALADAALLADDDDGIASYVRARVALLDRDLSAERYLRKLIDSGVDAYEARVGLARAALLRDDFASATRDTEAALAAFPDGVAALDLCLRLAEQGVRSMNRDRCARRLIDVDETASELALSLLARAAARGDFRTARILGERLVYVVPSEVAVHSALASAYHALGMPDDARRAQAMVRALSSRTAAPDVHR